MGKYDWPEIIEKALKVQDCTKPQLAEKIGVHRNQVYNWAKGVHNPNVEHGMALLMLSKEGEKPKPKKKGGKKK